MKIQVCPMCCDLIDRCTCEEAEPRERRSKAEHEEWREKRRRVKEASDGGRIEPYQFGQMHTAWMGKGEKSWK